MCKAITKKGKRCHHPTEEFGGFCKKHKSNHLQSDDEQDEVIFSEANSTRSQTPISSISSGIQSRFTLTPFESDGEDQDEKDTPFTELRFQQGLNDMEKYVKLGRMSRVDLWNLICNQQFGVFGDEDGEMDKYFIRAEEDELVKWFFSVNHEKLIDKLMKYTNIRRLV